MSEEHDTTVSSSSVKDIPVLVPVIITMANMINYLSGSMYQGLFTYNHERAWARLNEIYTLSSKTPNTAPTIDIVDEFCSCVASLKKVTETDDGDYYNYMRRLRQYCNSSSPPVASIPAASEKEPPSSSSWYYNDSDADIDADSDGELEIDMMRREMTEWTAQIRWRNR